MNINAPHLGMMVLIGTRGIKVGVITQLYSGNDTCVGVVELQPRCLMTLEFVLEPPAGWGTPDFDPCAQEHCCWPVDWTLRKALTKVMSGKEDQ